MSVADGRANIFAAYASGQKPIFKMTLPGGQDEVWSLGTSAVVVPIVPANCPPALELALRIRRDTILTGKCPSCGAVPTLQPVLPSRRSSEGIRATILAALFKHRVTCPGRDESVRDLIEKHRKARAQQSERERFERAEEATRSTLDQGLHLETAIRTPATDEIGAEIFDALINPPDQSFRTCGHLATEGFQTWNVLIAEGVWRCDECAAYFREEIKNEPNYLGWQEEFACDLCRRYSPQSLTPLLIRQDIFVMTGAVCRQCWHKYSKQEEVDSNGHEDP